MGKDVKLFFAESKEVGGDVVETLSSRLGLNKQILLDLFQNSYANRPDEVTLLTDSVESKLSREEIGEIVGIDELAWRLWAVKDSPLLPELAQHIKFLSEQPKISQVSYNQINEDWHNKIFELYFALLILPACTSIDLDDPFDSSKKSGKRKRADIIAVIQDINFAFECKVLYSTTPKRAKALFDQLKDKAYPQLLASNPDIGIPVIGFKNQVDIDKLWPKIEAASDAYKVHDQTDGLFDELEKIPNQILETLQNDDDFKKGLRQLITKDGDEKNLYDNIYPGTINFLTGVSAAKHEGEPRIIIARELMLMPFADVSPLVRQFCEELNEVFQQQI